MGLYKKKLCASRKSYGERARPLVIANQDDGVIQLKRELRIWRAKVDSVRKKPYVIQEHHVKLSFVKDFGSFAASGEGQGFHAGRNARPSRLVRKLLVRRLRLVLVSACYPRILTFSHQPVSPDADGR